MEYKRNCPQCNRELTYSQKSNYQMAVKKNTTCRSCCIKYAPPFIRKCPTCSIEINYKNQGDWQKANKKNSSCLSCCKKGLYDGEKNHFFGKHHTEETKAILRTRDIEYTEKQKEQARKQLSKVANTKHPYEIWKEKFSLEEANKKYSSLKQKHSLNMTGSGNPMYGKTAPIGSGVGWAGWYKGNYFRSFRELSFMIEYKGWISAESKKYSAKYTYEGKERTCRADFIWNNQLIEIKPVRLQAIPINIEKRKALELLAKELYMIYVLLDPDLPSKEQIKSLWLSGDLKFINRFENRILRWAGCCV